MDGKYTQQIKCKQNKKMRYLDLLLLRYPMLACCRTDIIAAFEVLTGCYVSQGKMLVCGNGVVLLMPNICRRTDERF